MTSLRTACLITACLCLCGLCATVQADVQFECSSCSLIGDANGDGVVTAGDAQIIFQLYFDPPDPGEEICCVDLNRDGVITPADAQYAFAIALGTVESPGRCSCPVGVLTFDLGHQEYPLSREIEDTDIRDIRNLYFKIVQNPHKYETDIVVVPEFAFMHSDYPVALSCTGPDGCSDCTITNSNEVTQLITAGYGGEPSLMDFADTYNTNILLSVAELQSSSSLAAKSAEKEETLENVAILINTDGEIQYVRRKYDGPPPTGSGESYKVFDLTTVSDTGEEQVFSAAIIICQNTEGDLYDYYLNMQDIDFLLNPSGLGSYASGADVMQSINNGTWDYMEPETGSIDNIYTQFYQCLDIVGQFVHAGSIAERQGVFPMDQLPYVDLDTSEAGETGDGYIWAMVDPAESFEIRSQGSDPSPVFAFGDALPGKYTSNTGQDNVSPPLRWSHIPSGTETFVLLAEDMDDGDVHWILYNIPSAANYLPEAVTPAQLPAGTQQGINSQSATGYYGPELDADGSRHIFKLYALDDEITPATPVTRENLLAAMTGKIISRIEIMATDPE